MLGLCDCCDVVLLPVGTRVRDRRGDGKGTVSNFARQNHWTVPVVFDKRRMEGAYVLRSDLEVI